MTAQFAERLSYEGQDCVGVPAAMSLCGGFLCPDVQIQEIANSSSETGEAVFSHGKACKSPSGPVSGLITRYSGEHLKSPGRQRRHAHVFALRSAAVVSAAVVDTEILVVIQ